MGQVIVKHHERQKKLKKKEKDVKLTADFNKMKKLETEQQFKTKLDNANQDQLQKRQNAMKKWQQDIENHQSKMEDYQAE